MYYIDEYLTDYKWTNVEGWKNLSSDFFLARSFSFFRLTPESFERSEDSNTLQSYPDERTPLLSQKP